MRIKLLQALMVDGVDRPAGEVVEVDDANAGEWIGQGLAEPLPGPLPGPLPDGRGSEPVERAVVEPGRRADGPAQGKASGRKRTGGGS